MTDALQNEAEQKIRAKLAILTLWQEGIPWQKTASGEFIVNKKRETLLEYFPKTLSAFSSWDGRNNSPFTRQTQLAGIQRVSRETVNAKHHHSLAKTVEKTMQALEVRAKAQLESEYGTTELSKLKVKIEYLELLKEKNDQEIGTYEIRLGELSTELRKCQTKLLDTTIEARRRITELEAMVAKLTATLSKTASLKKHGGTDNAQK